MKRSRMLALIFVLMLLPSGYVWAQQATIYGCVKNNNGQVRIVAAGETCLPSEHAVQWTSGGAETAQAPPPATPGPLRVLDQNGVLVGLFASPNYAARQIGDLWVGLPVTPNGFQVSDLFYFRPSYQTTNCSGDAYLAVDMNNMLRTGIVTTDTATGHLTLSYPGAPVVDRTTIQSQAYFFGGTWVCYAFVPGSWMPQFGKIASVDLGTLVAPFKIVQ